jgi:hypothetical protein
MAWVANLIFLVLEKQECHKMTPLLLLQASNFKQMLTLGLLLLFQPEQKRLVYQR